MSPCICIDDSCGMFKIITGAHYWNPIIITRPKVGDVVYFEKGDTGVHISMTDNKEASFIFFGESDFQKHFEDLSLRRDEKIDRILKGI